MSVPGPPSSVDLLAVVDSLRSELAEVRARLNSGSTAGGGRGNVFPPRGGSGRAGRARFGARGGRGRVSPTVVRGAVPGFTAYGPNVPTGANGISDYCKLSDSLVLGSKPCDPAGGSEVGTDQHSGPGFL